MAVHTKIADVPVIDIGPLVAKSGNQLQVELGGQVLDV